MHQAGLLQPSDGGLVRAGPRTVPHQPVFERFVFPSELKGKRFPNLGNPRKLAGLPVRDKVALVRLRAFGEDRAHRVRIVLEFGRAFRCTFRRVFRRVFLRPFRPEQDRFEDRFEDRLGHPARREVARELLEELVEERLGNRFERLECMECAEAVEGIGRMQIRVRVPVRVRVRIRVPLGPKNLREAHGIEPHEVHLPDRKRGGPRKAHGRERGGTRHVVLRRNLEKILQRVERLRALADVVEDDERAAGLDRPTGRLRQRRHNPVDVLVRLENRLVRFVFREAHVDRVLVATLAEGLQDPRLSDPMCALQEKGLPVAGVFPLHQFFKDLAFHGERLLFVSSRLVLSRFVSFRRVSSPAPVG